MLLPRPQAIPQKYYLAVNKLTRPKKIIGCRRGFTLLDQYL
jgi:hypothetical protein